MICFFLMQHANMISEKMGQKSSEVVTDQVTVESFFQLEHLVGVIKIEDQVAYVLWEHL